MRIFALGMIVVVCLSVISFADTGGPDAYGYSWVDNDNGGGTVFNWVDIRNIGTRVEGLTDDNNVGSFLIGFDFPYYWYTINQFWIGSNGYIEFATNVNYAHPFANIPDPEAPNNYMSPLTGDLDFSRGSASCYYYSNNIDSLVVSWIHVGEFGYIDSTHTFQVILCASDSSITFQYGPNFGNFLDSGGSHEDVIGIEDASGVYGLQYLRENLPNSHLWHDGLAIRFHPEPNPLFPLHDLGVVAGFNNSSGAIFVRNNTPFTPKALYKNIGNQPETNIPVRCQIRRGATIVYNITDTLNFLAPGEQVWVEFAPQYIPSMWGVYRATYSAMLAGDQFGGNNTKITEIEVFLTPWEFKYCDYTAETGRSWNGNSTGFGVEYEVPEAVRAISAGFFVNEIYGNSPAYVYFLRNNGNGQPDIFNPILSDSVLVTDTGWVDIAFPAPNNLIFAANEKFYLLVLQSSDNTFKFGMDQTLPLSYRGWEYTDCIRPDRDRNFSDIMFRIYADTTTASSCSQTLGDVNADTETNMLDITAAVNYFRGLVPAPDTCICGTSGRVHVSGDVNGSCSFDGIDVTYFVNYFKEGPGLRSCPGCRFAP